MAPKKTASPAPKVSALTRARCCAFVMALQALRTSSSFQGASRFSGGLSAILSASRMRAMRVLGRFCSS